MSQKWVQLTSFLLKCLWQFLQSSKKNLDVANCMHYCGIIAICVKTLYEPSVVHKIGAYITHDSGVSTSIDKMLNHSHRTVFSGQHES